MSYGDARQNRAGTIGAVVVVHAALGYALMTGLATNAIHRIVSGPLETYAVPIAPPPPPEPLPQPKIAKALPRASETLTAPEPRIAPPSADPFVVASIPADPGPIAEATPGPAADPLPPPPAPSLARGVSPRGNQGDWFPAESYPSAARRAGAEGLVSVRVTVATTGRITDCTVTASSGNADLDGTTCRLAMRNGRFEPARDANGQPVASSFALRNVRWRLTE